MSLRKRLQSSRERSAHERSKRRTERRRAERAKRTATPKPRGPVRSERGEGSAKRGRAERRRKGDRRTSAASAEARKLASRAAAVGGELLKFGRELLVIPAHLWLRAAEAAGGFVLGVWRRALRPALVVAWRASRAALGFADRHLTPARAVAAVGVVAAVALGASQWLDYHSVSVGTDAYSGDVGAVAPPPEVETEIAGRAHAWIMVPLALTALAAVVLAVSRRPRAAALLVPIGAVVLAIALIIDVPKGLDEGTAAVAYDGAEAHLLEGFWVQIAAGVVLIATGLLLPRYLRPAAARPPELTGPSLFDRGARVARERARRAGDIRSRLKRPRVRVPRPKRKVEGART
jgi:hypothetical protein